MKERTADLTAANEGLKREMEVRRQAEERLEESEVRYRVLFESSPLYLNQFDREGRFLAPNPAMLKSIGIPEEELVGKKMSEIFPGEVAQLREECVRKALNEGQPQVLEDERAGRYFHTIFVPVKVPGKKDTVQAIGRDITEQKKAERAQREAEEKFVAIASSANDAVILMDNEGKIAYWNESAEKIFGYAVQEITGRGLHDILAPQRYYDSFEKGFSKFKLTGQGAAINKTLELAGLRKDGTEFSLELSLSAVQIRGEWNAVGIVKDITERKRAEEEREALFQDLEEINRKLDESNRELQDFAYIASHDLQEPLRKITAFGSLLQDSLKGKLDEDEEENFTYMTGGAQRMQVMINDLLSYSRLTTKAKPFQKVDLNEVVRDLKGLELATLLEETSGTIHLPDEPLPSVYGDPSQMHQLLQNLIGNGLKFHREGVAPEITIRTHRAESDMVYVEVEDNGIGIPREYYEQIFTMFKRIHSRERYEGTGIGLAVCKKIVSRHGGDIGIKSIPGEGTTFWFTLPAGDNPADN